MWMWARKEWIWIQVKFADDDQTTVPDWKLYSTNDGVKSCNNFFCFLWIYYSVRQKVLFATSPRFHPTNSTNSSKKSSWWNDCSTKWIWEFTPQAVLIHLKKAPDGMIVPAPEIENIQVRCLFCTRDRPPGRQISRNDDDLYPTCHCICTEDRWEFYQLVEKIWTRGRRPPNFF